MKCFINHLIHNMFDIIKGFYSFVSGLGPGTKNFVICVLACVIGWFGYEDFGELVAEKFIVTEAADKKGAERYAQERVNIIDECVKKILAADGDASNVVLLNYHNSQASSHGFSYLYITGLVEEYGDDAEPVITHWHEINAFNLGTELDRIHRRGYLRIDSLDASVKAEYPKLYYKLKECGAEAAGFYPIQRSADRVGMIAVLYGGKKEYGPDYYMTVVEPVMIELYELLQYNER